MLTDTGYVSDRWQARRHADILIESNHDVDPRTGSYAYAYNGSCQSRPPF